ncbi:MAG: hypothetical protein ACLU6D_02090 [Gordonibacter urolithinfaciens]
MRKRLLALALLTTLACALAPSVTFADERGATPTPVTIEVGDDGAPVSTSGDGWTYDNGELVLEAGYAFAFTGHAFDVSGENRIWNSGIIVDGIFVNGSKGNGSTVHNEAGGVIQGGTFNMPVNNYGTIEGGTFHESAHNHGKIAGGTFDDYVTNSEGAVVSGGVFEDGGNNNSVDNSGTIGGGEFNIGVNNSGAIEGRGVFNAYVQNGNARFGTDKNKSCTISGGTFNSEEMDNFGTIEGGTFNGEILSRGIIAGGTFSSTSTVASNDEDTTDGGGTISGGTFAGPVTNGDPDPDWNAAAITGGTFAGAVTNYDAIGGGTFSSIVSNKEGGTVSGGMFLGDVTNRGVIEGGFFARPIIIGEGGTVSSCTFPVNASLAGLSLAGTGAEQPVATYEKDGEESNCLTLTADTGYTLPSSVSVRLESADGRELVAGTDYTYNDATGVVAVKKGAVAGPLFLAASGVPAIAPAPEPTLPTPGSQPSSSSATLLAATGDSVQPTVVAGIVLLAAGTLAASAIASKAPRITTVNAARRLFGHRADSFCMKALEHHAQ